MSVSSRFLDFLISSFFYFVPSLRHLWEHTFTDVNIASKRCIYGLLTSFPGSVSICSSYVMTESVYQAFVI